MIFGLVNEIGWSFVVLLLELCNHSEVFYVNEKPNGVSSQIISIGEGANGQ